MSALRRVVMDTNVLVSAALGFGSVPRRTLHKARAEGVLLASEETIAEFQEILLREALDPHVERRLREGMVEEFVRRCTLVPILAPIHFCRNPRDDRILEVAVHGRADAIVTRDADLLALHPFHGVAIVIPLEYLERTEQRDRGHTNR